MAQHPLIESYLVSNPRQDPRTCEGGLIPLVASESNFCSRLHKTQQAISTLFTHVAFPPWPPRSHTALYHLSSYRMLLLCCPALARYVTM